MPAGPGPAGIPQSCSTSELHEANHNKSLQKKKNQKKGRLPLLLFAAKTKLNGENRGQTHFYCLEETGYHEKNVGALNYSNKTLLQTPPHSIKRFKGISKRKNKTGPLQHTQNVVLRREDAVRLDSSQGLEQKTPQK